MVNMNKVKATIFEINVDKPQRDGLIGVLFIIYFENALRKFQKALNEQCPLPDTLLSHLILPLETTFADNFHHITTD